jgi:4-hydroxy-3-methylbut-2-enyl diphosphate reductase
VPPIVFRKGLDLKQEVAGDLAAAYHSTVVEEVQKNGYVRSNGRLTVHLAREFGFCYGVDRAVDYAYQTRRRFPDRRVYLTGEIIHNSQVNDRLRAQDIRFLSDPGEDVASLGSGDVVILPAFGVSVGDLARLDRQGCTLVDTTCGSVLNVWKNVRRYAQDGFTSVIHGKVTHEETRATASQATAVPGAHFVVVRDEAQTARLCDFIRSGGDGAALVAEFGDAMSPGFDPARDLIRVGCANQTTMLMSESLKVGEMLRDAMVARYGAADLASHFRAFDTICSATQERQDAVEALLDQHPLDLAIVVGGYNSSNTCNLARICAERVPTYHIAETGCLVSASQIRHRPIGVPSTQAVPETWTSGWLPAGPVAIGLTAGASTPNSVVGEIIERLESLVGVPGRTAVTEIS